MRKYSIRQLVWSTAILCLIVAGISVHTFFGDRIDWFIYVAVVIPFVAVCSMWLDREESKAQPDLVEDPLLGSEVVAIEDFRDIDDGFEGRVLMNGAPWTARSSDMRLMEGDTSVVVSRSGSLLELDKTFEQRSRHV